MCIFLYHTALKKYRRKNDDKQLQLKHSALSFAQTIKI